MDMKKAEDMIVESSTLREDVVNDPAEEEGEADDYETGPESDDNEAHDQEVGCSSSHLQSKAIAFNFIVKASNTEGIRTSIKRNVCALPTTSFEVGRQL